MRTTNRKRRHSATRAGEGGVVHPAAGRARPAAEGAHWKPENGLRPGFTVPELAVVLTVVGLLTWIAVPRIEVERFRMDGATRGATAALVSAQRLAVKRQHDVVVAFDTASQRLLIHQDRDGDGSRDAGEPVRTVSLGEGVVFGLGDAPFPLANGGAVSFTGSHGRLPAVRFIRDGSASEEGDFFLTSARSLRQGDHPADARRIHLDRATGRVTWYQYRSQRWTEAF